MAPTSPRYECCDNALHMEGECWDNFSWPTEIGSGFEYMKSGKQSENEDCCMTHNTAAGDSPVPDDIGIEVQDKVKKDDLGKIFQTQSSNSIHSSVVYEDDDCGMVQNLAAVEDIPVPDDRGTSVHNTLKKGESTKLLWTESPNSMHSSGEVYEDDIPMERAKQDEALKRVKNQGMEALEDSNVTCVSSQVASHQKCCSWVQNSLIRDSPNQSPQEERKRFNLDELITGAIIAECQLHKKLFSHYDLEPLSRLLSTHMASIFQKENMQSIVLKDLVAACNCGQNITLQRFMVALLSAAHQQNIGSWKDSRMKENQILLQEGISGKLDEVEISISCRP
ncbi:hypothetical protein L7F22_017671 [Adiantum nelumboides]|nr:hypothetical protein [Adiantum nelumboides]MCO5564016.1 hypothetical protein [Adiantum nelumboides]